MSSLDLDSSLGRLLDAGTTPWLLGISSSLLCLLVLLGRYRSQSWVNPLTVFLTAWMAAFWISSLNFLGYYPLLASTYALVGLPVVAFSLGFLSVSAAKPVQVPGGTLGGHISQSPHLRMVLTAAMAILLLILVQVSATGILKMIAGGDTATSIRTEYGQEGYRSILGSTGGILSGRYGMLVFQYVVWPAVYLTWNISILIVLQATKQRAGFYLLVSFILMLLLDLQAFSRGQMMYASLFLLLASLFRGHLRSPRAAGGALFVQPVFRRWSACIFLGGILLLFIISALRAMAGKDDVLSTIIITPLRYISGPLCLFQERDAVMVEDNFPYSLGGVADLFNETWRLVFRHTADAFDRTMDLQAYIEIGPNVRHNAHYTWCLAFYQDWGVVGLVPIPLLFGFLVAKSFYGYQHSGDLGRFVLFITLLITALLGVLEWRLGWGTYLLTTLPGLFLGLPWNRPLEARQPRPPTLVQHL